MEWFRWHHGSVTDPKFQLVAKKAGASTAEVLAVWACLLEEASMADQRGNPGTIDFDSLDCLLGLDEGKALAIYERMNERGLFKEDGEIEAWDRRQPKREREDATSTDRSRTFRAKQRQATPSNANEHTETPREEKSREEINTGAKAPKSFVLPDWAPPDAWRGYEEMRVRIKKPMTDRARKLVITELQKLRDQGHDPAAVLDRSTVKGWTDVYPIKGGAVGDDPYGLRNAL
jgi:hypothetical protein